MTRVFRVYLARTGKLLRVRHISPDGTSVWFCPEYGPQAVVCCWNTPSGYDAFLANESCGLYFRKAMETRLARTQEEALKLATMYDERYGLRTEEITEGQYEA